MVSLRQMKIFTVKHLTFDFSKAKTIVGISADFLGTWFSHVENNRQYADTRRISDKHREMSRHFQFESNLSLTGSNADYRSPIKPSDIGPLVTAIYNRIANRMGVSPINSAKLNLENTKVLDMAVNDLLATKGESIVVCGANDPAVQVIVNGINELLGNYGTTVLRNNPQLYRQGNDIEFSNFVKELNAGKVDGVIFFNCNPVYDSPEGVAIESGISKVKLTVSTSDRMDETSALVEYVAPDHHYLEQWNDTELKPGSYSMVQPTISPLFSTRQAPESFLKWSGNATEYYAYLQINWRENFFTKQTDTSNFQMFWDKCLYDGVYEVDAEVPSYAFDNASLTASAASIAQNYKPVGNGLELALYEKLGVGNGSHANNPWLQELSDPISKATWDNYVTISIAMANEMDIKMTEGETELVTLTADGQSMEVPVLVQPGQANGTIGLAIGYGRTRSGRVGDNVGVNAYPLISKINGAYVMDVLGGGA